MENSEVEKKNGEIAKLPQIQWHEEEWPLDKLKKFDRNPRKITSVQFAKLKSAIETLGYHHPIAIQPDGTIISGHQRAEAMRDLGHTNLRVSLPSRALTEPEFKQMLIQANINNGEFDIEMLQEEFEIFELEEYGLDEPILKAVRGKTPIPDNADDVPPIASVAVSQAGDTWLLGEHRLRCGDSTSAEDVDALLAGAVPHLMVTDPPYGVEYDASWREGKDLNIGHHFNGKEARATGKVLNDDRVDWKAAYALFPGVVAYVWHAGRHASEVQEGLNACGFEIRSQIIWAKPHFVMSRGHYHWQHESCWYAVRAGGTGHWQGDRKQTTLWEIAGMNSHGRSKDESDKMLGHSTQKPVECMKRPIENNSAAGEAIYEPFSGSGTTIIAAEITSRKCYAMELSPLYVDMAVKRWQKFTGRSAVKSTGERFDDLHIVNIKVKL